MMGSGFNGIATDVLGQCAIQSGYEGATKFLHGAIDSIPAHIAILDGQGTVLFVNENWKRFAVQNGFQGDDFGIGSNYLAISEQDKGEGATTASDVVKGIRSVINGESATFEYEYPCDSPTEKRWFLMTASRFDGTGPTKLVVSHKNITDRKLSQQQLQDLNSQLTEDVRAGTEAAQKLKSANSYIDVYRKIVDHHAIVAETDNAGTIVSVNDAFCKISGYQRSELIGQNHRILNSGVHTKEMWKHMYESVAKEGVWHGEICNRAKNGELYWVDTTIASINDDLGKLRGYFAIRSDITSLKTAQAQAESANRIKSEFLANMSHELRTPMTAILGYADILAEDKKNGVSTSNTLECIDTIKRNGEHLLSIINDLLDISKIETDRMTTEKIKVSPLQIVQDVAELMKLKSEAKGLSLEVLLGDSIPEIIVTDPTRLRQILMNLVGNAIKFTEVGGVAISVRMGAVDPELIVFDIIDTGIGLRDDQIARLFQPFEQADTSMNRKYGGTGLGLQISKRLAKILGGDITVSCTLGSGCVFSASVATGSLIDVDLASAAVTTNLIESVVSKTAEPQVNAAIKPSVLMGLRILLVEDGPDNQRLIAFHLRKAGATVDIVENGKQAVESLTVGGTVDGSLNPMNLVDLVLMDMQMPEMDGYEATQILRAKGCHLPILALTAHAMDIDEAKCLASGCNIRLTKPIDKKKLIEACAQFGMQSIESQPG